MPPSQWQLVAGVALATCGALLLLAAPSGARFLCCESTLHEDPQFIVRTCDPNLSGNFSVDIDNVDGGDYYGNTEYERNVQRCRMFWEDAYRAIDDMQCLYVHVADPYYPPDYYDPSPPPPVDSSPPPSPGGSGDPHITGFDGSSYLLWGKPNATYNLISERNHHVNVHLYHPPARAAAHALYMDAVGVLINSARISVQLQQPAEGAAVASLVLAVPGAEAGTELLRWGGQPVERAVDARTSYNFKSPTHVVITSRDITLSMVLVENDHLDVLVEEVATYWGDVHGIMGQSYSAAFRMKYNFAKGSAVGQLPTRTELAKAAKKRLSLKGSEDDYVTSGLLEADNKFSRFVGSAVTVATRKLMAVDKDTVEGTVQTTAGASSGAASAVTGVLAGKGRSLLIGYYACKK